MDFYRSVAAKVLNKPESKVTKFERDLAKHLCPPLGISPTNTGTERVGLRF